MYFKTICKLPNNFCAYILFQLSQQSIKSFYDCVSPIVFQKNYAAMFYIERFVGFGFTKQILTYDQEKIKVIAGSILLM